MNARFRFVLITVAAVLAVVVTALLGRWQLSRADEKIAMASQMLRRAALPTLQGPALTQIRDPADVFHRGVVASGRWLAAQTVYLDNRQMNGRPGLYVVTPLQLEGSGLVVLVQRGWVARNFLDRSSLPAIDTPVGLVQVQGRIAPLPAKLYEFSGSETGQIRQNLDVPAFAMETGLAMEAWSIQASGAESEGLLREWPVPATGVEKHNGYAFQWFALSGLIFILYVWFQIVRRFIQSRSG